MAKKLLRLSGLGLTPAPQSVRTVNVLHSAYTTPLARLSMKSGFAGSFN